MRVAGYEFSEGARFQAGAHTKDPDAVGRHIDFLRQQQKGELEPVNVVDDARNPNSPLHSFFEWDDGAAAELHRLHQARGLIRSVVAIYVTEEEPARRTKAFVHVPEQGSPHYRSADHAMSQRDTRALVLGRAWKELQDWKRRYKDLAEFAAIIPIIDEVGSKLPRGARKGH